MVGIDYAYHVPQYQNFIGRLLEGKRVKLISYILALREMDPGGFREGLAKEWFQAFRALVVNLGISPRFSLLLLSLCTETTFSVEGMMYLYRSSRFSTPAITSIDCPSRGYWFPKRR